MDRNAGTARSVWTRAWPLMGLLALLANVPANADELTDDRIFDPSRVIEIAIQIPADDWNQLRKQSRDPGKVFSGSTENPFTYFKADLTIDGVAIPSVGLRKKGFLGSLDDRFPSFKVKFDEYVTQSPIRGLDGLTLNNNKQDSSLTSQFLAYQLFNAAGVHAPRCAFVRVTVNGQYLGIYSNVESISKPFLGRRFGNNSGNLYEGTLADFYPKSVDKLEVKTNKKNHDRSKIANLATLLAVKDDLSVEEIGKVVDIDNFLRFWAMESLIGFWDGYANNQNNFWIYENRDQGKLYFMPWGADGAFMPAPGFGFGPRGPVSVYAESMLANRLYRDTDIAERYRETMRWLLANVWKEDELVKSVDQIEGLLTSHLHSRQAGAPRAMRSVRQFIRTRRATIEKELETWPVKVAQQPRKPMYNVSIGTARGSFSTNWSDQPPSNIAAKGTVKLQFQMQDKPVEFKQIGASVHRPRPGGFPFAFGAPASPPPPTANIVISGVRDSDGKTVTLTVSVDQQVLKDSIGKTIDVQGSFADGSGGFMPFGGRTVSGTLTIAKGELKANEIIEGEFELTIFETRGGFMDRRGQGGGGPGVGSPPPGGGPGFPMFGMGDPRGIPWSTVALVNLREVQDELMATEEQRKQLQEARRGLDEQGRANMASMQNIFELPEEERNERFRTAGQKMEEANRQAEKQIQSILNATQTERLKQLQLQREGVNRFAQPDVIRQLELTEQQQERIRSIRETGQPFGPVPFGQTDEQRRELQNDVLSVLTDEQKSKWATMTGKEFRFPIPAPPFGPPGNNPAGNDPTGR